MTQTAHCKSLLNIPLQKKLSIPDLDEQSQ